MKIKTKIIVIFKIKNKIIKMTRYKLKWNVFDKNDFNNVLVNFGIYIK